MQRFRAFGLAEHSNVHAHTSRLHAAVRRQQRCCRRVDSRPGRPSHVAIASADPASATSAAITPLISHYGDCIWASCVSSLPTVNSAIQDAVDTIMDQHGASCNIKDHFGPGRRFEPDLAIVFASCNYGPQLEDVVTAVRRSMPSVKHIFGCTAFGVLGSSSAGASEVEGEPGISLTLAALPGVELSVMHTLRSTIPDEDASPDAWADLVGMSPVEELRPSPPSSTTATTNESDNDGDKPVADADSQQQSSSSSSSNGQAEAAPNGNTTLHSSNISSSEGGSRKGSSASDAVSAELASLSSSSSTTEQQQLTSAVSFLVLCDPRFQQSKQLLAGLDFAFPNATKVGAVLSQGQQNKRRLMYVWSADGSVQPGTGAWARKQRRRRRQQQEYALAGLQQLSEGNVNGSKVAQQQQVALRLGDGKQQQQQDNPNKKQNKGLFGGLFDVLLSGLSDDQQQQQEQQQQQQQQQSLATSPSNTDGAQGHDLAVTDNAGEDVDELEEAEEDGSGVFMYGAAVLAMKGPLTLDPITCQGYRTVSDKVWVVGSTSRDGDLIGTLIDPEASADEEEQEGGEVVPLIAVYELLMSAGFESDAYSGDYIEQLSEKLAVAICPDSWRPASELQPDDFQVAAIAEMWQKSGYIRVDGQARSGYRLKLVLRDEAGIKEDFNNKLLGIKRAQLADVLAGNARPPALAALMFSDIGRGSSLYDAPSFESGALASYLPVPISGVFGSAQVSTVNGKGALYELTSAIAVVRPLADSAKALFVSTAGDT